MASHTYTVTLQPVQSLWSAPASPPPLFFQNFCKMIIIGQNFAAALFCFWLDPWFSKVIDLPNVTKYAKIFAAHTSLFLQWTQSCMDPPMKHICSDCTSLSTNISDQSVIHSESKSSNQIYINFVKITVKYHIRVLSQ